MVRKSKADAEITRQAILSAATEVFWREGVTRASLESIAQEAGVTRGAVYWHFKNKADVYYALYDQTYTTFHDMLLRDLQQDHTAPLRQLEELCAAIFETITKDEGRQRLMAIFLFKTDYSAELESVHACQSQRKAESIKLLKTYFERAKKRGHLSPGADPQLLTLALLSYLTGITYEFLRFPEIFKLKKDIRQLFQYFFAGLSCDHQAQRK